MIASSLFEIILADFRFQWQGPYAKVDMIPAIGIENRLKRTRKSTEESFRYTP